MEINLWLLGFCALALLCGGIIKGTLGVGTPLLTVPLMAMVLPIQAAITLMCVPILVANVIQAWQAPGGYNVVSRHWPTAVSILVGTVIGVSLLSTLDDRPLLIIIGSIVILFTLLQVAGQSLFLAERAVRPVGCVAGLLSGIVGGMSSLFGPVFIMYLLAIRDLHKEHFVAVASFFYLCAVIPWPFQLAALGLLDKQMFLLSCLAVLPVAVGLEVGRRIRNTVSDRAFRFCILMVLLLSGGSLMWRGFMLA